MSAWQLLSRYQGSLEKMSLYLSLPVPLAAAGSPALLSAPRLGLTQRQSLWCHKHLRGGLSSATACPRLCKWATITPRRLRGQSTQQPMLATCRRCRPPWMLAGRQRRQTRCVEGEGGANRRGRDAHPHPMSSCAGRLVCLDVGRRQRPPRGPPHSPGGRRQPGRF